MPPRPFAIIEAWTLVRPLQGGAVRLFGLTWSDERSRTEPRATKPLRAIDVGQKTALTRVNLIALEDTLEGYLAAKPLPQDYLRKLKCFTEVSLEYALDDIQRRNAARSEVITTLKNSGNAT